MGAMPIPQPIQAGGGKGTSGAVPIPMATGGPQPVGIAQTGAGTNPYVPPPGATSTGSGINTTGGAQVPNTNDPNQTNLQKQETDIYGKGVGGELSSLISNISGVNSSALSNYVASLQPQEAQAQANVNAQLGAGGVSANSSVAAIADSNLQAQETAAIAGESAKLQVEGQQLEASILTGQQQQAAQEVSASGWSVFGDVLGAVGGAVGTVAGDMIGGPALGAALGGAGKGVGAAIGQI